MPDINSFFDSLDDEELRIAMALPSVQKIMEATRCDESHDLEHHWPFNIDRQEERLDCIFCGVTKRQVMAKVVGVSNKREARPIPKPGKPPGPGVKKPWEE